MTHGRHRLSLMAELNPRPETEPISLPCLLSKMLLQLGLREAGQFPHVLNPQGLCDGDAQLSPEVTSAQVNEVTQSYNG